MIFRLWACIGVLMAAVTMASAQPQPADAGAVRTAIEGQMAAFGRDDGPVAFGFAAPSIRERFSDPDTFMRIVRQGYQPVYRPKDVSFGELSEAGGGFVQQVYVTGPDDLDYLAVYTLERQPDGSFKITGCNITRVQGGRA